MIIIMMTMMVMMMMTMVIMLMRLFHCCYAVKIAIIILINKYYPVCHDAHMMMRVVRTDEAPFMVDLCGRNLAPGKWLQQCDPWQWVLLSSSSPHQELFQKILKYRNLFFSPQQELFQKILKYIHTNLSLSQSE